MVSKCFKFDSPYTFNASCHAGINNIDPDTNFYSNKENHCNSHTDKNVTTKFKYIAGFSIVHFNARSLSANLKQIEYYLNLLDRSFDIIAVSEIWHNHSISNSTEYNMQDYIPYQVDRGKQDKHL